MGSGGVMRMIKGMYNGWNGRDSAYQWKMKGKGLGSSIHSSGNAFQAGVVVMQ